MDSDRPHFRTTSLGSSSTNTTAAATTSELFICFTSRLSSSSSSMKLTKSILSPGRAARDCGPVSLSSSLSRRLRTNGSLKGGQASPFFTTSGKKRGCAFENPEPSSPKVTCIGQVRVKTKKKVKQSRSLSKRSGGEVSFRKIEQVAADGGHTSEVKVCTQQKCLNASEHFQQQQPQECLNQRNQRWVHLPISICEGLRSFGSEFSCLFPCKSSCFSNSEREKIEKQNGSSGSENGCGAVFTRWLVSVNDGEGGKRREIELVVGGGDEEIRAERISMRSSRRHVFEDIEVKEDRIEVKGQNVGREDEAARVSICIPPKNALLLMRCRSDPMKMAALANRFSWDAQAASKVQDEDIEEESNGGQVGEENEDFEEQVELVRGYEAKEEILMVKTPEIDEDSEQDISVEPKEEREIPNEAEGISKLKVGDGIDGEENQDGRLLIVSIEEMVEEKQEQEESQQESVVMNENTFIVAEEEVEEEEEEVESNMSSFESLLDQENAEHFEDYPVQLKEDVEESLLCHLSSSIESDEEESESNDVAAPPLHEEAAVENENEKEETGKLQTAETNNIFKENDEENQVQAQPISEPGKTLQDEQKIAAQPIESEPESKENQELLFSGQEREKEKEKESPVLPECLLLMMCEPKLSMEVSKETWVCSTDFVKWLPERALKPAKSAKGGGCDHVPMKRRLSVDFKPKPVTHKDKNDQNLQQPRRSSCSLPPATAAASMATLIEQQLVNAVAYEPLVLTRCKSEPMRTAASKLMPESCFWKNAIRKLEPQRRATLGAARVGF